MNKIRGYKVVVEESATKLMDVVNKEIESGWQPFGGVSVQHATVNGEAAFVLTQAMVKYSQTFLL